MKEKELRAAFKENCTKENMEKLAELKKTLELAKLGQDVQRQHFKDIENKVLQENEFFCARDFKRTANIKVGERITSEEWDFLLSDEEFDRLQNTMLPLWVEAGLTDERGYYKTNWDMIACNAKRELVEFIILNLVPKGMREIFWRERSSVLVEDKIISAFDSCFA